MPDIDEARIGVRSILYVLYCGVTPSRADKDDDEVNESKEKKRLSYYVLPLFPFMVPERQIKPSCSREATPASVSQLAFTLPSSAPYYTHFLVPLISISPAFYLQRFEHGRWWTDKMGGQGEQDWKTGAVVDYYWFVCCSVDR